MVCCTAPRVKEPSSSKVQAGPNQARQTPLDQQVIKPATKDDAQDTKAVHVYAEAGPLPHTSQQQVQKQTPAAVPLAGTEYAQLSGRLVDMVSAMRSAGAQAELDLPAIVVVGNQSAGKSSLIEALCNVALPRSDGTCTRCPTEVRMTATGGSWGARVSVRVEWDDATASRLPAPQEVLIQDNIRTPSDIEAAVQAAQAYVLSGQHASPGAAGAEKAAAAPLSFSRNTVCVEITGAPVSLCLVDLPGIIHAVEHPASVSPHSTQRSAADYPGLIKDLVKYYISRPTSVIVMVLSAKEEMEGQSILSLVRKADPPGSRTLGVLTKPDTIEPGTHQGFVDLVTGKRWPLRLGYYVVRCPGQAQLAGGISHSEARAAETSFFASTLPWSQLPQLSQLGTSNLRNALANLLANLTLRSLPGLAAQAESKLREVEAALSRLPPPALQNQPHNNSNAKSTGSVTSTQLSRAPGNSSSKEWQGAEAHRAMAYVLDSVCTALGAVLAPAMGGGTAFNSTSSTALAGALHSGQHCTGTTSGSAPPSGQQLCGDLMRVLRTFKSQLMSSRPAFLIGGQVFTCEMDGESHDPGLAVSTGMGGASGLSSHAIPIAWPGGAGTQAPSDSAAVHHSLGFGQGRATSSQPGYASSASQSGPQRAPAAAAAGGGAAGLAAETPQPTVLTLEDVNALVAGHRGLELPGFTPFSALRSLVSACTSSWGSAADRMVDACHASLSSAWQGVLKDRLGQLPASHREAVIALHALGQEAEQEVKAAVESLVAMECAGPFTLSLQAFEAESGRMLAKLRAAVTDSTSDASSKNSKQNSGRQQQNSNNGQGAADQNGPGALTTLGTEQALMMVAVLLTYFPLAARRLADTAALHVLHGMVGSFGKGARSRLTDALLMGRDTTSLMALLREEEGIAAQREDLSARRAMLQAALKAIRSASVPLVAQPRPVIA